jgi:hypothetical protein
MTDSDIQTDRNWEDINYISACLYRRLCVPCSFFGDTTAAVAAGTAVALPAGTATALPESQRRSYLPGLADVVDSPFQLAR